MFSSLKYEERRALSMSTMFPNIDFKFRTGYKEGYKYARYQEGSLNFLKDSRELFVEKDGLRFSIASIIFDAGTEAAIRAIPNPENKIYLSSDTFQLLYFDRKNLEWMVVGSDNVSYAMNAMYATCDVNGNDIVDYYYPKADALRNFDELELQINGLKTNIGNIVSFRSIVVNTVSELPEEGEAGVIYLVPLTEFYNSAVTLAEDGETSEPVIDDSHLELLWIMDPDFGGYYEIIGNTNIDLSNYFNKDEIENLFYTYNTNISTQIAQIQSNLLEQINGIRSIVNGIQSSTTNKLNSMSNTISSMNTKVREAENSIEQLEETVATHTENIESNDTDIENLKNADTNISNTFEEYKTSNNQTVAEIKESVNNNTNNISELSGKSANHTEAIRTANDEITSLKNKDTEIEQSVNANTEAINSHKTEVSQSLSQLENTVNQTISNQITEIRREITEINQNSSGNTSDITEIRRDITSLQQKDSSIEQSIGTTNTNLSNLADKVSEAERNIQSNANSISTINENINSINNEISTIKQNISNINSRIEAISGQMVTVSGNISSNESTITYIAQTYAVANQPDEG